MTTATTQTARPTARAVAPPATGPRSASTDIDFDTRLMCAGIFMDFVLGNHPAVQEARQAVADAIAAADLYARQSVALEAATRPPETFRSHPILKRAGDIIRSRGWHQGSWAGENGAVCALMAIRLAAGGNGQTEADAVAALLGRIRSTFGDRASSVPFWNDRSSRTLDQVLAVLH